MTAVMRTYFQKEIKVHNVTINGQNLFDQPVKEMITQLVACFIIHTSKKTRSEQMANTKCLFKSDILNKFYSNSRMHWECNIVYYS